MAQDGPKRALIRPKKASRWLQDDLKTAPADAKMALRWLQVAFKAPLWAAGGPKMGYNGPKIALGRS